MIRLAGALVAAAVVGLVIWGVQAAPQSPNPTTGATRGREQWARLQSCPEVDELRIGEREQAGYSQHAFVCGSFSRNVVSLSMSLSS